jgi:hypothetical protein
MSDSTLIVMVDEGRKFEPARALESLRNIPGISAIRKRVGDCGEELLEARFSGDRDSRLVELLPGQQSVAIHGSDRLALDFALRFAAEYRKHSDQTLQTFNANYSFHQLLSPDLDLALLMKRIVDTPFSGAPSE